jgi:hypothetical protein
MDGWLVGWLICEKERQLSSVFRNDSINFVKFMSKNNTDIQ